MENENINTTEEQKEEAKTYTVEEVNALLQQEADRRVSSAMKKKEREIADAVNKGDNIAFAQEKMIEEQKDNLTSNEKAKLEGLVSQMKEAVKAKDVNKINELEASINETWQAVSQRVYANNQSQQTAQQPTDEEVAESAAEQPNDVQDAEFEEVK